MHASIIAVKQKEHHVAVYWTTKTTDSAVQFSVRGSAAISAHVYTHLSSVLSGKERVTDAGELAQLMMMSESSPRPKSNDMMTRGVHTNLREDACFDQDSKRTVETHLPANGL